MPKGKGEVQTRRWLAGVLGEGKIARNQGNTMPTGDTEGTTKRCVHQDPGSYRGLSQTCLKCLGEVQVSSGLSDRAAADLGAKACEPTTEPHSRQPTEWRTIIPKKFLHCYESSRAHKRFPGWDLGKGLKTPWNLTVKASGI